uniref:hypothetical protein n=1 Tax=Tessaracoccus timonensis TaxID=2161816 RepID=UPI00131EE04B|nr:hypothetical protein [Tessaracoccus timonensis]
MAQVGHGGRRPGDQDRDRRAGLALGGGEGEVGHPAAGGLLHQRELVERAAGCERGEPLLRRQDHQRGLAVEGLQRDGRDDGDRELELLLVDVGGAAGVERHQHARHP